MGALCVCFGLAAVADLLGEVLNQVADAPRGVLGPGEHALGVELGPKPHHIPGWVVFADGVKAARSARRGRRLRSASA